MYYKGNKKQCQDYNKKVTLGENYQDLTNNWANIISNKNGKGFAIIKHNNYKSNMTLINKIPDSWINQTLI
jgi:hypothetical protein